MNAVNFKGVNVVYAKDQPQYSPLPVHKAFNDRLGTITSCWEFSWREFFRVLFTRKIYVTTLTFNEPLQPMRVSTEFTPSE